MARSFNGTTDIINLVASSVLDITTQLAISVWINPGGNSGTNPIVGNGAGGAGGRNFVLDMRTTQSAIEISTGVSSSFGEMRVTGLTLNTGTWYHIAFSIDWSGKEPDIAGYHRLKHGLQWRGPSSDRQLGCWSCTVYGSDRSAQRSDRAIRVSNGIRALVVVDDSHRPVHRRDSLSRNCERRAIRGGG